MPRRSSRKNPLLSANRTPTPEMKDYQEYIDPQLWMLANGGDVQAMYEMGIRGPAHWLPARPNPEDEYRRNIRQSARTFHRIGMAIPRGRYPKNVEADLIAEYERLARTNAGKKGMGRAATVHYKGGSRTERESEERMAWRARAKAASDEADEQLRQEERERDLKATLRLAGFTQAQIVAAVRASRTKWAEERKTKKNPQTYGGKIWPDAGMIWEVVAWRANDTNNEYTKESVSYLEALPLTSDEEGHEIDVAWVRTGGEWRSKYRDGAENEWLLVATQVPSASRPCF